jgi:pyruvate, orthophosphate dikinase
MSRDDSGSFLPPYQELDIVSGNPFASIDQTGVGELMKIAIDKAHTVRPQIKLGICGEHGGDPASVMFCHTLGLTYVSCSPFRVPVARLAAAQAALKDLAAVKPSKNGAKKVAKPAKKVAASRKALVGAAKTVKAKPSKKAKK